MHPDSAALNSAPASATLTELSFIRASLFTRGCGNILPSNARAATEAYIPGMTHERCIQQPFSAHRGTRALSDGSRIAAGDLTMRFAREHFGREYYRRYYLDPRTAVATRREMHARARLIAALTGHVGLPVRRILEAGCGTGTLRTPLRRLLPRAPYLALESREYLCRRYGLHRGRIHAYRSAAPFD